MFFYFTNSNAVKHRQYTCRDSYVSRFSVVVDPIEFPLNAENGRTRRASPPIFCKNQRNHLRPQNPGNTSLTSELNDIRINWQPIDPSKYPGLHRYFPARPHTRISVLRREQPTQCPTCTLSSPAQRRAHNLERKTRLYNVHQISFLAGFTTTDQLIRWIGIGQ